MPVATTAAFAAVASSQAALANAAAHRAKVERCKGTVDTYSAHTASVSEMRDYADCVQTLYPLPISSVGMIAAKVFFVIALIGMAAGAWLSREDNFLGWARYLWGAVIGFIVAPCVAGFVAGVAYGVYWLFT